MDQSKSGVKKTGEDVNQAVANVKDAVTHK
jgi:hypothetical protein